MSRSRWIGVCTAALGALGLAYAWNSGRPNCEFPVPAEDLAPKGRRYVETGTPEGADAGSPSCEEYADRVRELLKEDRFPGLDPAVVRFIEDVPSAATKDALGAPFNPPWAVWWKCEGPKELHLVGRLRSDQLIGFGRSAARNYVMDIVDGLRARGFDPNADRLTIHYTIADTGSYAKFDPRVRYPARRE